MHKMRFSGQTSGSFFQILLILGAAVLSASCSRSALPASSAWFVREEGSFRRMGGFADLPPAQWKPWEEAFTPRDAVLWDGEMYLLINRVGAGKLGWKDSVPVFDQLASFRSLEDQVLHQLWTWEDKFLIAARPLEPHTLGRGSRESASLLFWSPNSPIFSPLPVGTQVRNPLLINLYVKESDGHWDMLWEKPTSEILYSRYYPGSGTERSEDLPPEEFWRESDAGLWESLPEDWKVLTADQKSLQGETLLTLNQQGRQTKSDYIHRAPGPGIHRIFALEHPAGKGYINQSGTLVFQAAGAQEAMRWNLPRQADITFPWFIPVHGGILVVWEQSSGKHRSHWGVGWIPLAQGL